MCDSKTCKSERIFGVSAKCSDRCCSAYGGKQWDGYAPRLEPIGGGDYLQLDFCLDCGKIQGTFPISEADVAEVLPEDTEEEEVEDEW